MAYTEADVEQARVRVRHLIASQVVSMNEQEALEVLLATALEGAKVPGLVEQHQRTVQLVVGQRDRLATDLSLLQADVAALQAQVVELGPEALRAKYAAPLADEVAVLVRRKVIDSRSPAADALLDFRDPPSTPRADRLAALESQAATLTAERDAARSTGALLATRMREIRGERDALRAQVARAMSLLPGVRVGLQPHAVEQDRALQVACEALRAALSAPPAETTPATEREEWGTAEVPTRTDGTFTCKLCGSRASTSEAHTCFK